MSLVFNAIARIHTRWPELFWCFEYVATRNWDQNGFNLKINFLFYTVLHWSLLHCCHSAEAFYPLLLPAVGQIISICFARYIVINVSCCTKKVGTGLWVHSWWHTLTSKLSWGWEEQKKSREEQLSERKGKIFSLQFGRAMTRSSDKHHLLGVPSRMVDGQGSLSWVLSHNPTLFLVPAYFSYCLWCYL